MTRQNNPITEVHLKIRHFSVWYSHGHHLITWHYGPVSEKCLKIHSIWFGIQIVTWQRGCNNHLNTELFSADIRCHSNTEPFTNWTSLVFRSLLVLMLLSKTVVDYIKCLAPYAYLTHPTLNIYTTKKPLKSWAQSSNSLAQGTNQFMQSTPGRF